MRRAKQRFVIAAAAAVLLVISAILLLFWQVSSAQRTERDLILQQIEGRAKQLAVSVSDRIAVLVRSIDFVLLQLRHAYGRDEAEFGRLVELLGNSFPEEPSLLLQLSIVGPGGEVVYSSLERSGDVNVADRDPFRAHLDGRDRLYISRPVIGRVTKIPTVVFTRPILRDGQFAGVAAISLSVEQIGRLLASLAARSGDEIGLLDAEGILLSLSSSGRLAELAANRHSEIQPFLRRGDAPHGVFQTAIPGENAHRAYAWHRVGSTGLAAVVGLDSAERLAFFEREYHRIWTRISLLAAGLVALAATVVALLFRMWHRQQALTASEARYRSLTQLSSDWYWEQDENFRFTLLEGNVPSRAGTPVTTHLGKTRWEIPAPNLSEADWEQHRADLAARRPFRDFETVRVAPVGGARWVSVSGEPVFDEDGRFAGYRGVGRDITARKRMEQALRDLAERLRIGQATARMIVMEWDIARDQIDWSDSPEWLRGPLPAAGRYPFWKDQVHPEDRERFLAARARSIESLKGQSLEYRIVRTDGEVLWLRSYQAVFAGSDGRAARMIVAMLDITERKAAEAQLRESEARLAEAQRIARIGSWELDLRSNVLTWSDEAYRIFEIDRSKFGTSYEAFLDAIHPEDRAVVDRAYKVSLETRTPYGIVHRLRMADGRVKHVEERCETEFAADGAPLLSRGTVQDVTEGRSIELRVAEQARLLDLIFRFSPDNIVLLDRDFNFLRVSDSYARACQRDIADFAGRNHFDLYPSDLRDEAEQARAGKTVYTRSERPFVFPDHPEWGVTHWDIGLVPILGADGEVELILFTLKDVTERVRTARALRAYASRLRQLSRRLRHVEERERQAMARELHDRIGQNLSTLDLMLGRLGQQIASGALADARAQLADMRQLLRTSVGHSRDLMSELRPPALEEFGLVAALKDLAADISRKTRIAVTIDGAGAAPRPPLAAELALYRIAQEALNNAVRHAKAGRVRVQFGPRDGAIELAISDDGIGFDPRATRVAPSWGLATMRERAEEAGIEFTLESAPGRGTRVVLRRKLDDPWPST